MCDICRNHPCDPACPGAMDDPALGRCVFCGNPVFRGEGMALAESVIHDECFVSLCERNVTMCAEPFVGQNPEAFFLHWWFDNLPAEQRADLARRAFEAEIKTANEAHREYLREQMREFCRQSEAYPLWLRSLYSGENDT